MLLHPSGGCYWSEIPLLIDAGPIGFTPVLNGFNEIDLLLTHSHDDHIGGVSNINVPVRQLYIPAYFPEIVKIAKFVSKIFPMNQKASALNNIGAQYCNIQLLYEGCQFGDCQHVEIFNPPLDPALALNFEIPLNEVVVERANTFAQEILRAHPNEIFETSAFEGAVLNTPDRYEGRNFTYIFLDLMRTYWLEERDAGIAFDNVVKYDANKMSVVFRFEMEHQLNALFTGDADKSVFNRLIKQGHYLEAEVLKVPHHGSRYNLSPKILQAIAPKIALVSHDNGKYGKAKDPHPNFQTILWLINACGMPNVYYTNDVFKHPLTVAGGYTGSIPNYQVEIR